jgi:hypothetical protein
MGNSEGRQDIPIGIRLRFLIVHREDIFGLVVGSCSRFVFDLESFSSSSCLRNCIAGDASSLIQTERQEQ